VDLLPDIGFYHIWADSTFFAEAMVSAANTHLPCVPVTPNAATRHPGRSGLGRWRSWIPSVGPEAAHLDVISPPASA